MIQLECLESLIQLINTLILKLIFFLLSNEIKLLEFRERWFGTQLLLNEEIKSDHLRRNRVCNLIHCDYCLGWLVYISWEWLNFTLKMKILSSLLNQRNRTLWIFVNDDSPLTKVKWLTMNSDHLQKVRMSVLLNEFIVDIDSESFGWIFLNETLVSHWWTE
jgi:hypothetical protein